MLTCPAFAAMSFLLLRSLLSGPAINQSINMRICTAQNKQSMSSNALSVTALEQTSFQFFVESVWAHGSSTQFCRESVPRRATWVR